ALPAPIALCVLVALLVHVAQALRTRQFVPHPALARGRVAVTGLAAVACALFALGFGLTWWVVHDHDRVADRTVELATTGTSPAALVTTGLGLLAAALTVAAAHWRRDLAPPVLPIAWFAVGCAGSSRAGRRSTSRAAASATSASTSRRQPCCW